MIFFDQVEYGKIPIWENKRRIKALLVFRDLYLDQAIFPSANRVLLSPTTGQPFKEGERRSEINHRKPAIRNMVTLAGVAVYRATVKQDGSPIDVDVLNHLWELETKRVSLRLPVDVIEEAHGVYSDDQAKSWFRTFWPFFWVGRAIDWTADAIFHSAVVIFDGNPQKARASGLGRVITGIERLTLWIATVGGTVLLILQFLGFEVPIRHWLHLQ
jgi:hypothetical protein